MKRAEQLALNDFRETFDLEETMATERDGGERDMGAVIDALANLSDEVRSMARPGRGRRRDRDDEDDRGMSVRDMDERGGRRGEPHSISFEVKVPVGRNGGTLRGFVTFDNVTIRDDRDIEDLANEVERKFRCANVFTKQEFRGNGNGFHGGGGYNGGGGGYYRGDGWRDRDRRY